MLWSSFGNDVLVALVIHQPLAKFEIDLVIALGARAARGQSDVLDDGILGVRSAYTSPLVSWYVSANWV